MIDAKWGNSGNDIIKKLQLGLSAISIGISEGAFETGLAFVKVKRRFGKPLIDATVYQHQFADLYTKLCGLNLSLLPTRIG